MSDDNTNLNVNRARGDKYSLVLSDIPSSKLLIPEGMTVGSMEYFKELLDDKNRFYLSLKRVELPGITLGEEKLPTTFVPISLTTMTYSFDPLTTTFRLDEHYQTYQMMLLWMYLIKNPEGYNQFNGRKTFDETNSQGSLMVKGNMKNTMDGDYTTSMIFDFTDLRPMGISSITLDYSDEGEELEFTVSWMYSYWIPRKFDGTSFNIRY